jgi:hypothetical protein
MKKVFFWLIVSCLTFLLGVCVVVTALFYKKDILQDVKPPVLTQINPVKPSSFPGLSRKISEIKKGKTDYFPKDLFGNDMSPKHSVAGWYSRHLKAMSEVSFLNTTSEETESYRFLWLRSFNHPIFVRVERRQNSIQLFFKELDGAGGYEPGKVIRKTELFLDKEKWEEFIALLEEADYWKLPSDINEGGLDGAKWILEGVKDGHYHIVERWSPEQDKFQAVCIYLLKLSGVEVDKLGEDLY